MNVANAKTASLPDPVLRLDANQKRRLVAVIADRVIGRVDELTALDSAIGDGDHGHNLKRGFEAVLQELDDLSSMNLPDLARAVGTKLVMKVGGASGPLYGTLFLALGKELPAEPSRTEAVRAFAAAISAVKARGKSDVGQKTMLDVLVPVYEALAGGEIWPPSGRLRLVRRRRPCRCGRRAAAPPFSAIARSDTWIPARAHRR